MERYAIFIWPTTENCFGDIAILIKQAFNERGYECNIVTKLDEKAKNIIFGANAIIRHSVGNIPIDSVIINMEQLYDGSMWITESYLNLLRNYEVWDYNQSNVNWIEKKINKKVKLIQLGYSQVMETVPLNNVEEIDVLFYGGLNQRRLAIYEQLRKHPEIKNVQFKSGLWGAEKDYFISKAKIVLNLHFYDACLFEYPRVIQLLNNKKFVITETSSNQQEYDFINQGLVICDYHKIVENVVFYLKHPQERKLIANRGYQLLSPTTTSIPIKPHIKYCLYIISIVWSSGNSYYTFVEVARMYQDYLNRRGYETIISKTPLPDYQTIVFGANVLTHEPLPSNAIIMDLEQLSDKSVHCTTKYLNLLRTHEVWTYSLRNVDFLKRKGIVNVKYVPLYYMPCLDNQIPQDEETIDVLFYGELSERRKQILKQLQSLNVKFVHNVWGTERNQLIAKAKIILNISNNDHIHLLEVVRILPLLANKKFVISEHADNEEEYSYLTGGIIFGHYNNIVNLVHYYLNNPSTRLDIASTGSQLIRSKCLSLPLFTTSLIENLYLIHCRNPSDINEQLPVLYRYSQECNTIIDLSYGSVAQSLIAFLYSLATSNSSDLKTLISVNNVTYENINTLVNLARDLNINFTHSVSSDLQSNLPTTDLLFIDTWHVYGWLKRELNLYQSKVSKYIIMHDTSIDAIRGESLRIGHNIKQKSISSNIPETEIAKGIWPAIEEFLVSHPQWQLLERLHNNNGLTILKRIS